jgi:glyoxylase-like metal-dependent hydrolase (beta-lactamase superfamily II)
VADLEHLGVALVRAPNPGPLTRSGTNTWVIGRDPGWVIDPGPAITEHLDAVAAEARARGGAGGIAVTHDHADHVAGLEGLRERLGDDVPVAAATVDAREPDAAADDRGLGAAAPPAVALADGDAFGPLRALALPGHSDDHLVFVAGRVAFTGDAVLGEGSVFLAGRLAEYLDGLRRLRALELEAICPGHGPPVWEPAARIDEQIAHRLDRERRLVAALERGLRTEDDLLAAAWDDAPPELRGAATLTLRAHLEKLRDEQRLP